MKKAIFVYPFLLLITFFFGCAPVVSTELRAQADSSLTFKQVQENPEIYKGKVVLWGGEIVQVLPQENGTTFIEILEWPLNLWDKPRKTVEIRGKFLVLTNEALDTAVYKRGNRITLAGEIQGEIEGGKIKELTDSTYRYPVLASKEMHVWKYPSYPYSDPAPDYLQPWEYRPTLR